jgi:hypothetical protein
MTPADRAAEQREYVRRVEALVARGVTRERAEQVVRLELSYEGDLLTPPATPSAVA